MFRIVRLCTIIFRPIIVKWITYNKNNYLLLPKEVPIVTEAMLT